MTDIQVEPENPPFIRALDEEGRPVEAHSCTGCGALVLESMEDIHENWHRHQDRVERDAFFGHRIGPEPDQVSDNLFRSPAWKDADLLLALATIPEPSPTESVMDLTSDELRSRPGDGVVYDFSEPVPLHVDESLLSPDVRSYSPTRRDPGRVARTASGFSWWWRR